MRDLGLTLIILGVIAALAAIFHYATRPRPAGRHGPNPPGEADKFVAELRGQPADRFTPGVVVPFTPQLGEPLKPLPAPKIVITTETPQAQAAVSAALAAARAPDADADIRHAAEHFNPRPGDKPARPAHATDTQTTGEIFEHLRNGPDCWCRPWTPTPDVPPAEVVDGLNGHYTVDACVDSINLRAEEAVRFRAELAARLGEDDGAQVRALASGQADHG